MSLSNCASVRLAAVTQSALECSLRRTHRELGQPSSLRHDAIGLQIRISEDVAYDKFMHLADAFIQSDLHCIQVTFFFYIFFFFLSALAFPGNRTHDLGVVSAMLYHLSYRKASDAFLYI